MIRFSKKKHRFAAVAMISILIFGIARTSLAQTTQDSGFNKELLIQLLGLIFTGLMLIWHIWKSRRPLISEESGTNASFASISKETGTSAYFAKVAENSKSKKYSQLKKEMWDIERDSDASRVDKARARAWRFQDEGKVDKAIQEWRKVADYMEGDNNNLAARAWFSIGYLHNTKNRREAALLAYDKAIRLDDSFAEAYCSRGDTKWILGMHKFNWGDRESAFNLYASAIEDCNKTIQLNRNFAEAYICRGYIRIAMNQPNGAIEDYNQAIRLSPKDTKAYIGRGYAELHLENYESALANYNKAIRLKPKDPTFYSHRGDTKAAFGKHEFDRKDMMSALNQFKSALKDYNKAIRLQSDFPAFYNNRGHVKMYLGDYKKYVQRDARSADNHYESALEDYNKAICLDDDLGPAYAGRGKAKVSLEKIESALSDYQTALDIARKKKNDLLEIDVERQMLALNYTDRYKAKMDSNL